MIWSKDRMRNLFRQFIFMIIMLIASSVDCQNATDTNTSTPVLNYPTWLNSSQTQYNQFLTDKYNYYITPQGNKMWVGVMNLAWNQLKERILNGQNATFLNLNQLQTHMIDNLNAQMFTKKQLSQNSYYAYSGYGQQAINKINFDVRKKFPLRTLPELTDRLQETDFISFAYIFKNFKFPTPFSDFIGFKFRNVTVRSFQASYAKQRKQLYYKYYNNTKDFMLGIRLQNSNDEILLWKTNITQFNNMKMDKFMQIFKMFDKLESKKLATVDKFIMPVVDLDFTRTYSEMLNSQFTNSGFEEYKITKMEERVKLRITKEGVLLEAQGIVIALRTIALSAKYFYLDDKFWVIMREKNKQPYLVSLISNISEVWTEE